MSICVIGATGVLGRALMTMPNTIACPVRFEESKLYDAWFESHPEVDTVWHVARACRKTDPRRDFNTFMLEQNAMQNLLSTRARNCRFVYASTKVVYGITSNEITPLSAAVTAENFADHKTGTVNFPEWKDTSKVCTNNLSDQHLIYAMTKLVCEKYIQERCSNYKIIRIWDIC